MGACCSCFDAPAASSADGEAEKRLGLLTNEHGDVSSEKAAHVGDGAFVAATETTANTTARVADGFVPSATRPSAAAVPTPPSTAISPPPAPTRPVSLLSLAQAPAAPAATPATPAPPVIPFLPAIVPVAALPAPLASSVVLRATPAPTPAGVALPPQLDVFGLWTFWAPLAARDAPSAERAAAMQAVIEAAEEQLVNLPANALGVEADDANDPAARDFIRALRSVPVALVA